MQSIAEITQPAPPVSFGIEPQTEQSIIAPRPFKWTKAEYYKRTELIEGEIVEMPTMNSPHATALSLTDNVLRDIFSSGFVVRNQMPLDFGDDLELVPGIAIVEGKARDFKNGHPKNAVLVIEVADTTLRHDRNKKVKLYAENKIVEYWIVNIPERCLEIYRHPVGKKDTEIFVFDPTATVAPLDQPKAEISVADLLP